MSHFLAQGGCQLEETRTRFMFHKGGVYFLTAVISAALAPLVVKYLKLRCPHLPAQRRCYCFLLVHTPRGRSSWSITGATAAGFKLLWRSFLEKDVTLWEARRSPPPRRHRGGFSKKNYFLADHWLSFFMNKHLLERRQIVELMLGIVFCMKEIQKVFGAQYEEQGAVTVAAS